MNWVTRKGTRYLAPNGNKRRLPIRWYPPRVSRTYSVLSKITNEPKRREKDTQKEEEKERQKVHHIRRESYGVEQPSQEAGLFAVE